MKKLLQLYSLLIIALPSLAKSSDTIVVTGIKSSYAMGEPIKITITNYTTQSKYISLQLYTFLNEESEWFVQVPDLLNYSCDPHKYQAVKYILLNNNETITLTWDPKKANKKHCFNWKLNSGNYRIEVRVADDKDSGPPNFIMTYFTIKRKTPYNNT